MPEMASHYQTRRPAGPPTIWCAYTRYACTVVDNLFPVSHLAPLAPWQENKKKRGLPAPTEDQPECGSSAWAWRLTETSDENGGVGRLTGPGRPAQPIGMATDLLVI